MKQRSLNLKFGTFEFHMKQNIEGPAVPAAIIHQTTASPVPSKPAKESATAASPPLPKSSAEKVSAFTNVCVEKAAKLAALEASRSTGYVIVSSPKDGQVIGFVEQFGTELPVKSDVAGDVLKLLFNDGEAVGYGDPVVAVLPSP